MNDLILEFCEAMVKDVKIARVGFLGKLESEKVLEKMKELSRETKERKKWLSECCDTKEL